MTDLSDTTIAELCLVAMALGFLGFIVTMLAKDIYQLEVPRSMPWSTWCERLTDAQIEQASKPKGYSLDYRRWPEGAWKDWRYHAFHCQQFIAAMRTQGWVGEQILLYPNGEIDGNHRLRVVLYLMARGEWAGREVPCVFRALPGQESPEPTAIMASRIAVDR